jgi:hypothetical protein
MADAKQETLWCNVMPRLAPSRLPLLVSDRAKPGERKEREFELSRLQVFHLRFAPAKTTVGNLLLFLLINEVRSLLLITRWLQLHHVWHCHFALDPQLQMKENKLRQKQSCLSSLPDFQLSLLGKELSLHSL